MATTDQATASLISTAQLETFAHGLDHPEGIAVTLDGTVYVGGEAGQLYRVDQGGTIEQVTTTNGFLLGLAADAVGRIYACDSVPKCVWRIDPATGSMEVFCGDVAGRPLVSPNWGCFDRDGNYYVSDSGTWKGADGLIVVVRPGGRPEIWTNQAPNFPNGMTVSADGSRLFVLESTPGALVEFPINADGSAGERRLLLDLEGTVPDGVAQAQDGSLIIACYRPDTVYRWREDLGLQVLARDPEGTALAAPTNVVFTGPDLGTMVVPNIGRWHLTRFRHPELKGVPLNYPTVEQLGGQ